MKNKLKIFYVAPEVVPFAKTSNLAETAGAFVKYVKNLGHDVRVMMPKYRIVNERKYVLRDVIRLQGLKIKLGDDELEANGKSAFIPNSKVQIYFLDNKSLFDREGLYAGSDGEFFDDNAQRFIFFALGCLETLKLLYWQPDIIHCNDWQTALIPILLKSVYKDDPFFNNTKTLLSIHDFRQQGVFEASFAGLTGVPATFFNSNKELLANNQLNFLKSGYSYADLLNLVGDTPAVTSSDYVTDGESDLFSSIKPRDLPAISIGLDDQVWSPETDNLLPATYSHKDLAGKAENKKVLLEKAGFDGQTTSPLISVTPGEALTPQILLDGLQRIISAGAKIILFTPSDSAGMRQFKAFVKKNEQAARLYTSADPKSIHLLYAGSDISLLPIAGDKATHDQLLSLAYGTIPVVPQQTTMNQYLKEFDPTSTSGTAFMFKLSEDGLLAALEKALTTYADKSAWNEVTHNAMSVDVSWNSSVQKYMRLYHKLVSLKTAKNK